MQTLASTFCSGRHVLLQQNIFDHIIPSCGILLIFPKVIIWSHGENEMFFKYYKYVHALPCCSYDFFETNQYIVHPPCKTITQTFFFVEGGLGEIRTRAFSVDISNAVEHTTPLSLLLSSPGLLESSVVWSICQLSARGPSMSLLFLYNLIHIIFSDLGNHVRWNTH